MNEYPPPFNQRPQEPQQPFSQWPQQQPQQPLPPQQEFPSQPSVPPYPQYPYYQPQPGQYTYHQPPVEQPMPTVPPVQPVPPKKQNFWTRRVGKPGKTAPMWAVLLTVVLIVGFCGMCGTFATAANNTSSTNSSTNTSGQKTGDTQPTDTSVPTDTPVPTQSPAQLEKAYKALTTSTTVDNLDKDGNGDKGKDVSFTCKISNFVKDDSGNTAGANVDAPDYSSGVVQISFPDGTDLSKLNEGDILTVWGNDGGVFSGQNAFGGTVQEVGVGTLYLTDQTTGYQTH